MDKLNLPHETVQRSSFIYAYLHPIDRYFQLSSIGWDWIETTSYRRSGMRGRARAVLQLTLSGEGTFEINGQKLPVPAFNGFLCVFPGDQEYYFDASPGHWEFLYVAIHGDEARSHWLHIIQRWGHVIDFRDYPEIYTLVSQLYTDLYNKLPINEYEVSARLHAIVLQIYRCCEQKERPMKPVPDPFQKVLTLLHSKYAQEITLSDMAVKAGYSIEHFSRIFHAYFGMTPMQYLRKIRVEKAAHLLAHSSKTLDVITEETGFGNKSQLVKVFKQMVGLTPGKYREEHNDTESKSSLQIEP